MLPGLGCGLREAEGCFGIARQIFVSEQPLRSGCATRDDYTSEDLHHIDEAV